jgi:signal peptidase II
VTKGIARETLVDSHGISLLYGSVQLQYTENSGAMLGLGAQLSEELRFLVLVVLTSASLLVTLAYTVTARDLDLWQWLGMSFLTGGGLGNLIDRVFNAGAVTDFVVVGVGPLRTGVFNWADVLIMAGGGLLLLGVARREKRIKAEVEVE